MAAHRSRRAGRRGPRARRSASGRGAGSRVHCSCGALLPGSPPPGDDAAAAELDQLSAAVDPVLGALETMIAAAPDTTWTRWVAEAPALERYAYATRSGGNPASRRLDPDLNIWVLAEPLIEAWMLENRGPEARLRGAVESLAGTVENLPALIRNLETVSAELAAGGLRLHPSTVRALGGEGRGTAGRWALWVALGALALAVVALL